MDDNPKRTNDGQWQSNKRSKPQQHLKSTFDILLAKYKEGKAAINGRKN
jgi:hypothetical protein